ncbi:hypothetical protein ACFC08_17300 [Streptomyces sp. NPDC056112]|uniref:hypothetical protein n=1 Tax=Streptomyces sp. NPDC056112 TaxID=3345715 RepID=UPI0035E2F93F
MVQVLQNQHPFDGIGAKRSRRDGWIDPGREPQRGHLAGVSPGGPWTLDELLDDHRCAGQLCPPYP